MTKMRWWAMQCGGLGLALAAAIPPLDPIAGTNFEVSMPRGWTITDDAKTRTVIAKQNPRQEDSALVLIVATKAEDGVTDAVLMDAIAPKVAQNLTVIRRENIPGGGQALLGEGMVGRYRLRIGAVSRVANGESEIGILIARPDEFERHGGMELVSAILSSRKPVKASQPVGRLEASPLTRPVTVADLAGEWQNDDSVFTNYVNYRGDYAGYQSIAIRDKWIFDGQGGASSIFSGVIAGRGTAARQVNENRSGRVVISGGRVMTLQWTTGAQPIYVIRGWRELPGITVMLLNGPWYTTVPPDVLGNPEIGVNLNSYWVRKAR